MNTLHLMPYAGLCNRINAISSCVKFASDEGLRLKIFWDKNIDLSADFSDLFSPLNLENVELVELRWFHVIYFRARRRNLNFPRLIRKVFSIPQLEDSSLKKPPSQYVCNGGYLSTCHSLGEKRNIDDVFVLNETVAKELASVLVNFSEHTVGVHIRRGDHKMAIDASPIEFFLESMDAKVRKDAAVRFFLATDDSGIKDLLKNRYGDKIIVNESPLTRTSVNGMSGAVIDLWALANCTSIIGSKYSMFSLVASEIKNIPLEI